MSDAKDNIELSAVGDHAGILTIRGGGARRDWNGIHYKQGMSRKNVGTTSLSANIATIPPGGVAYAHIHVGFEVILYIVEGKVRHEFGSGYKQGMSRKNVGTTSLSANIATIPPGGVAYAHIHVGFEVILYIVEGKVRHEFGSGLKQVVDNEAGDFIYIRPGLPHEVFNMS